MASFRLSVGGGMGITHNDPATYRHLREVIGFCLPEKILAVKDTPEIAWMSGLREVAKIHDGDFRLTASQNLIIAKVSQANKTKIQAILKKHRIPVPDRWTGLRTHALSCVAFPTCGLAMAESERWLPTLLDRLEPVIKKAGLEKQAINLRVTGCPNGCARPYLGEIALVGKSPGRYHLYLGAGHVGERLNKLYRESLAEDEIIAEVAPLIERYGKERLEGEPFGDFLIRVNIVPAVRVGREFHGILPPPTGETTHDQQP